MNRYSRSLAAVLAAVAITTAIILWHRHSLQAPAAVVSAKRSDAAASPLPPSLVSKPPNRIDKTVDVANRLDAILARLAASQDADANRKLLVELRSYLASVPPQETSRAIQAFLAENKDAATKLDVTINAGGGLGDASSLRVFLLDYLGQLDRPAAGALAAQILSHYTTPDEWAVSLRNYAWANPGPDGDAYLQSKARELLTNPAWIQHPSAGFLEAFDTIVHAHGTALTPELATLVRDKDHRDTAHAAYLTLDRLTLTEPAATLTQFLEHPELMKGREQTQANYFARADVRQPEQRALVERYLLDPARTPEELASFAGLYPNANYMISNNLLTQTATPRHDELAQHDAAALDVIRQWLADPRFERLKPQIGIIRSRLETFVRQAAEG